MEAGPVDMGDGRGRLSGTDFSDKTVPLAYSVRRIFCAYFPSTIIVLPNGHPRNRWDSFGQH